MNPARRASVIVNNYDYGRFLPQAIESALAQTWPCTEVIVVDDGSRDESRDVIASYADRVHAVLKENGGQGSAFNAGFGASRGDVVIFLDSDDVLRPTAIEQVMPFFENSDVVKVHWPLSVIDETGRPTGQKHPDELLPDGDHRERLLRIGPTHSLGPPTSGNAWSRHFLTQVLPVPEELYRISADKHLLELAPFLGVMRAVHEPQSLYRRHGMNSQLTQGLVERLHRELSFYDNYVEFLRRRLSAQGIAIDVNDWKRTSWWHRQKCAIDDITALPAGDGPLVLVDDGSWGHGDIGRPRLPFVERDGLYWGQPADDATAIRELARLRRGGASFLVFVWSTFWWFDHYTGFNDYVRRNFPCLLNNQQVIAFDLRTPGGR